MNELQKLCDKVPSFDDKVAMDLLEAELGAPWQVLPLSLGITEKNLRACTHTHTHNI
jgi:hypothetical protein